MKRKSIWIVGVGLVLGVAVLLWLVGPFLVERRPGKLLYDKIESPIPGVTVRLRTHAVRHYGSEQELQTWCKSDSTVSVDYSDWLKYMSIDFPQPAGWKLMYRDRSVSTDGLGPPPSGRVYGLAPDIVVFDLTYLAITLRRCETISFLSPKLMADLLPGFLYDEAWQKSGSVARAFTKIEKQPGMGSICLTVNPVRLPAAKNATIKICSADEGTTWTVRTVRNRSGSE